MELADELAVLAAGAVEVEGRVLASSNQALYVSVTLDGVTLPACYKAGAGERRLWDFPEGLWRREVAAYELDAALGTGLVPATVGRDDMPYGPGSLQLWVDDNGEDHYFTLRERADLADWFADPRGLRRRRQQRRPKVRARPLRRRALLGHRQRAVLPRPRQAAHRRLGVRRRPPRPGPGRAPGALRRGRRRAGRALARPGRGRPDPRARRRAVRRGRLPGARRGLRVAAVALAARLARRPG